MTGKNEKGCLSTNHDYRFEPYFFGIFLKRISHAYSTWERLSNLFEVGNNNYSGNR